MYGKDESVPKTNTPLELKKEPPSIFIPSVSPRPAMLSPSPRAGLRRGWNIKKSRVRGRRRKHCGAGRNRRGKSCRWFFFKFQGSIIKPTSGKYGSNSSFLFYESRIYFLTSVRRAFMDAHLFKEIEETLQSDGVGAS